MKVLGFSTIYEDSAWSHAPEQEGYMAMTPEQLASARYEEAALHRKHAQEQQAASNHLSNQKKNAKVYADAKKSKSGFAFINRQCGKDDDPMRFKVQVNDLTYAQFQYWHNTKKGLASHVIKVEWSTHQDLEQAKTKYHQTRSFFNLYGGYEITRRAKKYQGPVQGLITAKHILGVASDTVIDPQHPAPQFMYGYNVVQWQRHGSLVIPEQSCVFMPATTLDGKHVAILVFELDGVMLQIKMHDMTTDPERRESSSLMVGYLNQTPSDIEKDELKQAMQRLAKK